MAWSLFPLAEGTDPNYLSDWAIWRELDDAIAERTEAIGQTFPRSCKPYWIGTVGSITETTLTIAEAEEGIWSIPGPCSGLKFFGITCPDADHLPLYYDVILTPETGPCFAGRDPRKIIRSEITDNDEDGNLTFEDISIHRDIHKKVSSLSELVGKPVFIIPRGGSSGIGLWWHERSNFPSGELWRGTPTEASEGYIKHAKRKWGNLAGKDIIYPTVDGLKRSSITSNTTTEIFHSGDGTEEGTATGEFYIVPSGGIWVPPIRNRPAWWYGGVTRSYRSLLPNDTLGNARHPESSVTWEQGPEDCEEVAHDALYRDLWSEWDEQCSTADKNYSPDFNRTVSGRQASLEELSSQYRANPPYNLASISAATPAVVFHGKGINATSTSATSSSGDVSFSVSAPYYPIDMYYTLVGPQRETIASGVTTLSSGTFETTVATPTYDGKTIYLYASWGWTRDHEKWVQYIYHRGYYDPPIDEETGEPIPPEDAPGLTGTWIELDPDENMMEYSDYGFPTLTDTISSGWNLRYVGSNWHDSVINGIADSEGDYDSFFAYWKHAEFHLTNDHAGYRSSKRGTALAGSSHFELKTNKSWWTGTLRTDSGTATSSTTTSLTDSTKASSNYWDVATGRWLKFVIEVLIDGVWHKRPITGFSGTTITWDEPLPDSGTDEVEYRIYEPDKAGWNRWKGRKLFIVRSGVTYGPFIITHSDNSSLFVNDISSSEIESIEEGDDWYIDEIIPGEVVECVGTGLYERVTNSLKEQGDTVRRYGKARKHDFLTVTVLNEMHFFIDYLRRTATTVTWRSREDDDIPENNLAFMSVTTGLCYLGCEECQGDWCDSSCADEIAFYSGAWGSDPEYWIEAESDNGPPYAELSFRYASCTVGAPTLLQGFRRYAYASVTAPGCRDRTVEIFIFTGMGVGEGTYEDGDTVGEPCDYFGSSINEYSWDLHNDGEPLGYHQWHKLGELSLAAHTDETARIRVGADPSTQFNYPDCPQLPDEGCECEFGTVATAFSSSHAGWQVLDDIAIILWHFDYMTEEV